MKYDSPYFNLSLKYAGRVSLIKRKFEVKHLISILFCVSPTYIFRLAVIQNVDGILSHSLRRLTFVKAFLFSECVHRVRTFEMKGTNLKTVFLPS